MKIDGRCRDGGEDRGLSCTGACSKDAIDSRPTEVKVKVVNIPCLRIGFRVYSRPAAFQIRMKDLLTGEPNWL